MVAAPGADASRPVLVAGATGSLGGGLVPELLDAGWDARGRARTRAEVGA